MLAGGSLLAHIEVINFLFISRWFALLLGAWMHDAFN